MPGLTVYLDCRADVILDLIHLLDLTLPDRIIIVTAVLAKLLQEHEVEQRGPDDPPRGLTESPALSPEETILLALRAVVTAKREIGKWNEIAIPDPTWKPATK
jgi:hypothetical protein